MGGLRLPLIHSNSGHPAFPRDQKALPDGWEQGKSHPEAGLVLGKAEGTLLTGASLSRKTEAADGLALGCLAQTGKSPRPQSHGTEKGHWGSLMGKDTRQGYPVPPKGCHGWEELERG